MPGCSTGRNIQKYKGAAASTLQDVTDNGNTTTGDLITTIGNIYVSNGYYVGDGSLLTGIAGASSAFSFQDTSDRGNTTSNTIQFTNTHTSLITSGNIVVAGNVTATDFYGDGTTLTGITLSTDMTSNVIRISNLESNLTANSVRIGSLETDLTSNATRVTNLETYLSDNASRTTSLETDLTSNASRMGTAETNISSLETDLSDNSSRITSLETDLSSNASRMGTAETNISSLETDVTSNTARVGSLETDLTSNASRITTVENNVLISNSSGITSGIGQGEILIGHLTNQLSTLALGADSQVLTCNTTSGRPEWKSASAIGTTVATLSNSSYIIGGAYNGGSAKTWSLKASTANSTDHIVIRDNSGDIYAREYHGDYIKHANDTDTYLGFPGNDQFMIRTGGTDRLNIDSSGNTTIPDYIKHTSDTNTYFGFPSDDTFTVITGGTERLRIDNSHTTIPDYIKHTSDTNTYFGFPSDDTYTVTTGGTERLRIDGGGDVGIGVTNPVYKLDVAGNMNLTSGLYLNGGAGGNGQVLTSSAGGLMTWTTPSTFTGTITQYITHDGDTNTYFGFPSDDTFTVITGGTERLRIDNSHTTIPDYIKHTSDTNTYFGFPSDDTYTVTTGGTERLRIDSGGDVGIGITNPQYTLDVGGNINLTGGLYVSGSSGSSGQVLKSTGSGLTWGTDNTGGSSGTTVWTKDSSTSKIYYNSAFVGINKTNPAYRLDVGGDINLTGGLYVSGSSGSSGQVLKSTGSGGLTWGTDNTGGSGSGSSVWLQSGSNPNYIVTTPTPQSNVGISNTYAVNHTLHIGSNVIVSDTGGHDVLRVNGNVFCTNYLFGDGSKIRNLNTIRTETGGNQISVGSDDGGPVLSWRERQIRYQYGTTGRPVPPGYGF